MTRVSRSRSKPEPAGPEAGGRTVGGRYLLAGRPRGSGFAAVDRRSGAEVQLDAVPLPETVDLSVEPFDQVVAPAPVDSTARRALDQCLTVARAMPDHPRLSQVFQVLDEGGYLWVVGEAVPAVTLGALLEHGPLSPYRAAELANDLLAALRAVHAAGMVHGNLTVDTVLVCDDGTALLAGLLVGVAQEALCGGPGAALPGAGVPAGPWSPARTRARDARAVIVGPVPERWAPEQVGPLPGPTYRPPSLVPSPVPPAPVRPLPPEEGLAVGAPADAWALGVLLYRAVTGEPPFPQGEVEELFTAIRRGRIGSAPAPRQLPRPAPAAGGRPAGPPPELPECGPLGPLVLRLLRTDPLLRPTLPEATERIRRLLVRAPEPVGLDAVSSVSALLPVPRRRGDVLEHPDFPGRHHHAAPARHPALLGLLLVGGVLLFALLAVVLVVMTSH